MATLGALEAQNLDLTASRYKSERSPSVPLKVETLPKCLFWVACFVALHDGAGALTFAKCILTGLGQCMHFFNATIRPRLFLMGLRSCFSPTPLIATSLAFSLGLRISTFTPHAYDCEANPTYPDYPSNNSISRISTHAVATCKRETQSSIDNSQGNNSAGRPSVCCADESRSVIFPKGQVVQ